MNNIDGVHQSDFGWIANALVLDEWCQWSIPRRVLMVDEVPEWAVPKYEVDRQGGNFCVWADLSNRRISKQLGDDVVPKLAPFVPQSDLHRLAAYHSSGTVRLQNNAAETFAQLGLDALRLENDMLCKMLHAAVTARKTKQNGIYDARIIRSVRSGIERAFDEAFHIMKNDLGAASEYILCHPKDFAGVIAKMRDVESSRDILSGLAPVGTWPQAYCGLVMGNDTYGNVACRRGFAYLLPAADMLGVIPTAIRAGDDSMIPGVRRHWSRGMALVNAVNVVAVTFKPF